MVLDGIESSRQTHLAKLLNVQCSPRLLVQVTTFYTKQGSTLMRSIGPNFKIPPAGSLLSLIGLTIFISIPIYDKILVPLARKFTGRPSGITVLQRIGIGLFLYIILSIVNMSVAGLVEAKRLKIAREHGLLDTPNAVIPMSIWWLINPTIPDQCNC
ncbi:hypothetical protein LWI29_033195 [Acer saccharum]|uniref:Uncharacterized protein n=1 Tax=Acer saccharum TaxID=4024 RepID=A0AA39SL25_ACESA|nr:hypothetical protein LWI29_033195 [Acer saccharum]